MSHTGAPTPAPSLDISIVMSGAIGLMQRHGAGLAIMSLVLSLGPLAVLLLGEALPLRNGSLLISASIHLLQALVSGACQGLLAGWATLQLQADRRGRPLEARDLDRRAPALLMTGAVFGLMNSLGLLLLVIPGVYAMVVLLPAAAVAAIEGYGPTDSLDRARTLTFGHRWNILALLLLVGFLVVSVGFVGQMLAWTIDGVPPLTGIRNMSITPTRIGSFMATTAVTTLALALVIAPLYAELVRLRDGGDDAEEAAEVFA